MEAQRLQKKLGAMVKENPKLFAMLTIISDNKTSGLYRVEYTSDVVAVDVPSFVDKCLFMQVDLRLYDK